MAYTLFIVGIVAVAFAAAFAALFAFSLIDQRRVSRLRALSARERDHTVFVFEDENLLDATPSAKHILQKATRGGSAWSRLCAVLLPNFPDLTDQIRDLASTGTLTIPSRDNASQIRAEWHDGVARIDLEEAEALRATHEVDHHSLVAMKHELKSLRAIGDLTPYAAWWENEAGVIEWCNKAYLDLVELVHGSGQVRSWPPISIFGTASRSDPKSPRHVCLDPGDDDARHWFSVTEAALDGGERFCSAVPIDNLIAAEQSRNEFVMTLGKTFAALPVGLAIFDRARELKLFNPALMDLTLLSPEFLVSKPSLSTFLDRLRDRRLIPEPRDYKSWRQHLSDLVEAAESGTYEETWTLPTGQTFRVSGRPHPEGAVAFLFEDITSDVALTRRFRAELDTGQATLDAIPQAIAVFSAAGVLTISNNRYFDLWGSDPGGSFSDLTIQSAIRDWSGQCAPSAVWTRLEELVTQIGPKDPWSSRVALHDGRVLSLRATPLPVGATLIEFSSPEPVSSIATPESAAQEMAMAKA